jgi:glycosyltransferase involved in cell wall biosynthesis
LAAEILPYRLDLLHSPDFIPPLGGYRRSIITVHDLNFLLYPQFLTPESRRYYNDQIRWAVKHCDAISADSHATKADLTTLLDVPPDKITVIHLGLEPAFSTGESSSESDSERLLRLKLAPGYILFVGTFEPRKNVPGLLRAYAALRRRWPDAPDLVLAGRQGWLFGTVVELIKELHLGSCTHFLSEVSEADLPALYRQAKAFVLPSYYEGFGFTLLEAMGCGTPAVVANRASLPEIAAEAALLVEPDDADSMADALYRTLSDEALRSQMRLRGLERAAAFTWQNTVQATLDLYRHVLAM